MSQNKDELRQLWLATWTTVVTWIAIIGTYLVIVFCLESIRVYSR